MNSRFVGGIFYLHLRQRLVVNGQRFVSYNKVPLCDYHTKCKFLLLHSRHARITNSIHWRQYTASTKDEKSLQKVGDEMKEITIKGENGNTLSKKMVISSAEQSKQNPQQQQVQYEIKTPKGILSITTTIEDSKINDIVMEKASLKSLTQTGGLTPSQQQQQEQSQQEQQPNTSVVLGETFKDRSLQEQIKDANALSSDNAKGVENPLSAVTNERPNVIMTDSQTPTTQTVVVPVAKTRKKVDFNRSSLERNFITPSRAITDFLLSPSDLEDLPKIKRRSPYEHEPPITVFWRRDVQAKALQIWGSQDALLQESLRREFEKKRHQQNLFTVKRRLRDYRREVSSRTFSWQNAESGLGGKSGKVVLIAVGINATNFIFKVIGWMFTGSHSMFSESLHSLADTINQLILVYGIHKSQQHANVEYPYGYTNMKYLSALVSGVGIFCVGAGVSIYHGITGVLDPEPIMQDLFWALFILGGSLVSEGATLLVAVNEVRRSAKQSGISFPQYVMQSRDPSVNVVLLEDTAAVSSVIVAVICMSLSTVTGSPIFDSIGSLFIGGILGSVASFLIYSNGAALVGRSINADRLEKINTELEADVMIRAIYDVKGIDIGNKLVRYKAELDFDGRELTRSYLDKQDLNQLLKIVKNFRSPEELEEFLLVHGESIVDLMGGEIDRIEMKLRKKFPEIRHCDLEIL